MAVVVGVAASAVTGVAAAIGAAGAAGAAGATGPAGAAELVSAAVGAAGIVVPATAVHVRRALSALGAAIGASSGSGAQSRDVALSQTVAVFAAAGSVNLEERVLVLAAFLRHVSVEVRAGIKPHRAAVALVVVVGGVVRAVAAAVLPRLALASAAGRAAGLATGRVVVAVGHVTVVAAVAVVAIVPDRAPIVAVVAAVGGCWRGHCGGGEQGNEREDLEKELHR